MGIQPLKRSDLAEHETLFAIVESVMGFVPNSMLIMGRSPDLLYSFSMFTSTVLKQSPNVSSLTMLRMGIKQVARIARHRRRPPSGISADLKWFIAYVTSLSGGCQYCQGHTAFSANRIGVSVEKLKALGGFEESELFTEQERSALRIALQSGASASPLEHDVYNDLKNYFDENEIIEIVAIISLFRFLNTWNMLMSTPLEEIPKQFVRNLHSEG